VVFTDSAQETDIQQAYALGANSYLKKPYTAAETTDLLKTVSAYWLDYNERPPALQRLP
jgi:CheY-like chemotaxis protein